MLEPADDVKDLGILINDSSLKFNSHIDSIVAKAHLRASLIHKCFVSKHPALLTRAFKVYVRPIVEYMLHVCGPHTTSTPLTRSSQCKEGSRKVSLFFLTWNTLPDWTN